MQFDTVELAKVEHTHSKERCEEKEDELTRPGSKRRSRHDEKHIQIKVFHLLE